MLGRHGEPRTGLLASIETVAKRVFTGVWNDGFIHAGNLAYMALLSLFPIFILAAAIFSAIGEIEQREAAIAAFLSAVPPSVAETIGPAAHSAVAARQGWLLWIGGLFGLWTGSSLVETIRDILHRAYGTPQGRAFWHYRLFSIGVIVGSVILLLLSLSAQVVISTVQEMLSAFFPQVTGLIEEILFSQAISGLMLFVSIYLLFVSLTPGLYQSRRYPKWPGALLVTVWWIMVTLSLPRILRNFISYDLTYGGLAGAMIALFFFWLVGLGMVVGAELNAALAEPFGEGDKPEPNDMVVAAIEGGKREDD